MDCGMTRKDRWKVSRLPSDHGGNAEYRTRSAAMAIVVADNADSCRKLDDRQLLPQFREWSRDGNDAEFGPLPEVSGGV